MVNALRRMEVLRPHLGQWFMEVCAEADCRDEELLAFANAEHGGGWHTVGRRFDTAMAPIRCRHDRRRMHFVLSREGAADGRR